MENKVLISVFVLFLGFSSVLFSDAVPISRSLKSFGADVAVQNLMAQFVALLFGTCPSWNAQFTRLLSVERRMDIETSDYSGPGANKDHDPNAPSRV